MKILFQKSARPHEAGQAVLIVLLTMVVALTVVLSIVSSSSSDIKLSTTESSSQRAFSAAEAGAEKALIAGSGTTGNVSSGATYNASVTTLAENGSRYLYPSALASGANGIFWLVDHAADKSLTCSFGNCFTGNAINLCWGTNGTPSDQNTTPALEVSVFYLNTPGNYASARVVKEIIDPNPLRRGTTYAAPDSGICTISDTTFAFTKFLTFNSLGIPALVSSTENGLQFISVRPLYSNIPHPVGITVNPVTTSSLPSQGNVVNSSGNLNSATRKVELTRVYGGIPSVFDAAIFSIGGI